MVTRPLSLWEGRVWAWDYQRSGPFRRTLCTQAWKYTCTFSLWILTHQPNPVPLIVHCALKLKPDITVTRLSYSLCFGTVWRKKEGKRLHPSFCFAKTFFSVCYEESQHFILFWEMPLMCVELGSSGRYEVHYGLPIGRKKTKKEVRMYVCM